jgi:hypothetical protein
VTRHDAIHVALVALAALACAHLVSVGPWVVDDAAIAWAYARNWANGDGLVPFVGGERVEGYSDFLWVALIALAAKVGVDAWVAAKAWSLALVAATVPVVYRLGAAAVPRAPTVAGFSAAALFAADTQVAIFGASGLENPLFSFLLALGAWGTLEEARTQRVPWSALAFLGLAVTRPEGIVYGAVGGLAALLGTTRDRRGALRIAAWLGLFFVPFLAYHAIRYWYFAWPFPMTYYAKVKEAGQWLSDARSRGWGYVLGYVTELGRGPMLPLLVVGRTGTGGRRWGALALALVVGCGAAFLPLPPQVFPAVVLALGALLALPGPGADGVTALCWAFGSLSALFGIYAMGDWMGAYRWLSFAAVPFSVLAGAGVAHLAAEADARLRRSGPALALAVVAAIAVVNVRYTRSFAKSSDISAFTVRERLAEATRLLRALHTDDRPRLFTIDMGGFMWFSDFELMDLVGLVDVTYAIQNHRRKLLAEDWLFRKRRPHLMFLSETEAVWTRHRAGAADAYVPLGIEKQIRRDLLFSQTGPGPGPVVDLGPVVVHGLSAPGTPVSDAVFVELALATPTRDPFTARVLLADRSGTVRASWPVPLAAGLVPPERWRPEDVSLGRYHLDLPDDVGPGVWELGVRITVDGAPLAPAAAPDRVRIDETGALWPGVTVTVVTRAEAEAAAAASIAELPADCAEAERAWYLARRRSPDPRPFDALHAERVKGALAACWVRHATTSPDPVGALERAKRLAPRAPEVLAAARARADALQAVCDAEHAAGAWQACTDACDDVLRLDPTRSWTRRRAEVCRDEWYTSQEGPQKKKRRGAR